MLNIRFATTGDVQKIFDIFEYYACNSHYTMECHSPECSEYCKMIEQNGDQYPFIVLCDNEDVVGYAVTKPYGVRSAYKWNVEISIYIQHDYTHLGAGRIIIQTLIELLRGLGFQNIYIGIVLPKRSGGQKFMKSIGFKRIGIMHKRGYKFNKWYDILQMEYPIGNHPVNAEPLKTISELDPVFVSQLFDNANDRLKQLLRKDNGGE